MSKETVLLDVATAGASGDMFLSALLDLLDDDDALVPLAASLLIYDPTIRVKVVTKEFGEHKGRHLEVTLDEKTRLSTTSLKEVLGVICEEVELSKSAKKTAEKMLDTLFAAESRAHDTTIEDLHLHEIGTVDTILDIAGVVYLLEKADLLGNAKFLSTHVATGSGTITTEHGELEIPVPAVAEILVEHDVPFHNGNAQTEMLTPTGAAILVTLVEEWIESSETFKIDKEGIGFGSRDLGDIPNMLRILTGEHKAPPIEKPEKETEPVKPEKVEKPEKKVTKTEKTEERTEMLDGLSTDEVAVIETNVDDVDGEIMGQLYDTLLTEGLAYDVVMIPAFGKKNRPCFVVKVIAPTGQITQIAEIMIKHLGTLGIRYQTWNRLIAARETIVTKLEVDDREFMVRVKISRATDGSIVAIKPEADDVIQVSKATGIPIRELKPRIALQAHAVTE